MPTSGLKKITNKKWLHGLKQKYFPILPIRRIVSSLIGGVSSGNPISAHIGMRTIEFRQEEPTVIVLSEPEVIVVPPPVIPPFDPGDGGVI
jgi:hypothetical protein